MSINYVSALNVQHYIVPMFMSEINLEDAQTAATGGTALTSWLDAANAVTGSLAVTVSGQGSTFAVQIDGTSYPLDGTGDPIRLLNITSAPKTTSTSDETIITHDQVTRGSGITVPLSDSHSFAFAGVTVHKNVDYKVMQVLSDYGTAERLGVKYLRVGPGGTDEKKLCYGIFSSNSEEGEAGQTVKFKAELKVLGSVFTILDN